MKNPGGYLAAHQPVAVDLDGDGRDEIMAGYAMLNADGTTRWVYQSEKIDLGRGHCDCFRLARRGKKPSEFRFVMTFCGANGIALLDGNGKRIWEVTGQHFESVDVGGNTLRWRENPGAKGGEWLEHVIAEVGNIETTRAWDIDGCGIVEIVPTTPGSPLRVYKLIKDGVKVKFKDEEGRQREETVRVLEWDNPKENDFLLVSQLWVTGNIYTRRTDLLGFVNGLPLVFIELKASHKQLAHAYRDNLRDYKETIPHLFWYNALIILSNGSATRLGSLSAEWEHFNEWKRINSEGERGVISLDTVLRGVCEKSRLLDIVENFMLYTETKGGAAVSS